MWKSPELCTLTNMLSVRLSDGTSGSAASEYELSGVIISMSVSASTSTIISYGERGDVRH